MTAAQAEGVQQQDLGGQARQVEPALVALGQAQPAGGEDHGDQHGQGDDVGRVAARQALEPEPGQGDLAAGDGGAIGLGQDEARQDQEEVGGQIAAPQEGVHGFQLDRRGAAKMEHHDKQGRDEAQGVKRAATRLGGGGRGGGRLGHAAYSGRQRSVRSSL
ncbi:hypothetical protein D3C80_1055610 [compost metagenome]